MVLGKPSGPGRPTCTYLDNVGQGPTVLAAGAGCLDIISLFHHSSLLSPSL